MSTKILANCIDRSRPGRKKTRKDDDICLVCGSRAIGINFGVHTCPPCKAFFRRNAFKHDTQQFQCRGNGNCSITSNTRRQCNYCRLEKCFHVGMNRAAIRTDDQRLERNRLIEYNRQKRKQNNQEIIRSSNLSNYNSSFLSSNDQILLTNIFNSYEKTCVKLKYHQHLNPSNDNNNTLSLEKFMNSIAHMYTSLIEYFKLIPEFSKLSYTFKKSLIKNNLNQLYRLNNALVIKATGIIDKPNPIVIMQLFPLNLFQDLCKCSAALYPFLFDPILLKLILIVLIFSSYLNLQYENIENNYSTLNLLNIQNIYVELLWKYILSRCSNYKYAVKLFSSFIYCLVYSQDINIKLNEYVSKAVAQHADQLVPIMKVMWLNDQKQS